MSGRTPLDAAESTSWDDVERKQRKAAVAELLRSRGGLSGTGID